MTTRDDLAALERHATTETALALFDRLPAVSTDEMLGRWRGHELPTGHPLDGRLEASGWYGKEFIDADTVHPLLVRGVGGRLFALDPRRVPLTVSAHLPRALVAAGRPFLAAAEILVGTAEPRARLRRIEHRGVVTAAMIYDHVPIIDVFRRVDEDCVLGLMDLRGQPLPYFFVLERDR